MQKHPNYLILIFSIVNVMSCYHLMIYMFNAHDTLCYVGTPQLLAVYLKPFAPKFTQLDALILLTEANTGLFEFWQLMALCLNACMCYDLMIGFKNPFQPGERRLDFYIIGSILVPMVLAPLSRSYLDDPLQNYTRFDLPEVVGLEPDEVSELLKHDAWFIKVFRPMLARKSMDDIEQRAKRNIKAQKA